MRYTSIASTHAAFTSDATEELARKEYTKLIRCTHGPYKVAEEQTDAVVINEDGILSRVAIDRVTPVHQFTRDANQVTTDNDHPRAQQHSNSNQP